MLRKAPHSRQLSYTDDPHCRGGVLYTPDGARTIVNHTEERQYPYWQLPWIGGSPDLIIQPVRFRMYVSAPCVSPVDYLVAYRIDASCERADGPAATLDPTLLAILSYQDVSCQHKALCAGIVLSLPTSPLHFRSPNEGSRFPVTGQPSTYLRHSWPKLCCGLRSRIRRDPCMWAVLQMTMSEHSRINRWITRNCTILRALHTAAGPEFFCQFTRSRDLFLFQTELPPSSMRNSV